MPKHTMNKALRALVAGAILLMGPLACKDSAAPPLAGARIGGPFVLTDQDGRRFDNARLTGRYTIYYFGYTYCPDVCPTDMQVLGQALRTLDREDAALAAKIQPVFVTVDPTRDTPPVVKQFVAAFHPRFIGLTGSEAQVERVAKLYGVYFRKQEPAPGTQGYLVDHMRTAFLFGPEGRPIALLPVETDAAQVVAELRKWVR
jgi:protein SCO1